MTTNGSTTRRVAFYLPALAAGGMERVTLLLAEALASRGFAVDIVLEHGTGGYFERVPAGVGRVVLETGPKWGTYARLVRAWPREGLAQVGRAIFARHCYIPVRRLASLVTYIDAARPAMILAAHGRIPPLALWARRLAQSSPRVAIIEHSAFSRWLEVFGRERRQGMLLRYQCTLMRRLYPQADAIIGVSHGVAEDLATILSLPRHRVTTIYNPVVAAGLDAFAARPVDHDWFAPGQPPVVLAAGRLVPEKDFSMLVRAFAGLRKHGAGARLVILGEGEQRSHLLDLAAELGVADDVDLPGWVDNPYSLMARARVFAVTSVFEGLCIALIEALACGCPVVSTDCESGPREILDQGRYGLLTPVGDAPAMTRALAQALSRTPGVEALKQRAGYFSVERAADAYQALIEAGPRAARPYAECR